MIREIPHWRKIFDDMNATPREVADRILTDMNGYPSAFNKSYRDNVEADKEQMSRAIEAYVHIRLDADREERDLLKCDLCGVFYNE